MNRTFLLTILFFTFAWLSVAQTQPAVSGFVDPRSSVANPESAQAANTGEDELYSSATNALNAEQYDQAVSGFDQVAKMRGRKADAALYWKAYALLRLARKTESLSTIDELKKSYPQSRWLHDAEALRVEIRGPSSGEEDPNAGTDDEIKTLALNSIMQADPERGVTAAQKLLESNVPLRSKERTLFILAQTNSEKAQQILLSVAKGTAQPDLQAYAIRELAVAGGNRYDQSLREIYATSTNPAVKKQVLRSFIINGDKTGLLAIIRQETSPDLRREAIRQLGPMGASSELRQIYKEHSDAETKEAVLQAMGVAGDAQGLIEIAKTETDGEVRSRAIRNLGIFGGDAAIPALIAIYDSNPNPDIETRRHIIRALFVHGAAKDLVALARRETNPELKKEIVRNLSLMQSPEATEYMMEILNK
jgi:HEAT repeat protein